MPIRQLATLGLLLLALLLWIGGQLQAAPEAHIVWATESEVDTVGFHVYRAPVGGEYERVSSALIPSQGDPFSGGEYEFRDPTVVTGQRYLYQLEELEQDGSLTRLPDTLPYEAHPTPHWPRLFLLVALLLLSGLWPARVRE